MSLRRSAIWVQEYPKNSSILVAKNTFKLEKIMLFSSSVYQFCYPLKTFNLGYCFI